MCRDVSLCRVSVLKPRKDITQPCSMIGWLAVVWSKLDLSMLAKPHSPRSAKASSFISITEWKLKSRQKCVDSSQWWCVLREIKTQTVYSQSLHVSVVASVLDIYCGYSWTWPVLLHKFWWCWDQTRWPVCRLVCIVIASCAQQCCSGVLWVDEMECLSWF